MLQNTVFVDSNMLTINYLTTTIIVVVLYVYFVFLTFHNSPLDVNGKTISVFLFLENVNLINI